MRGIRYRKRGIDRITIQFERPANGLDLKLSEMEELIELIQDISFDEEGEPESLREVPPGRFHCRRGGPGAEGHP